MTEFYPDHAHDTYRLGVPVLDELLKVFAPQTSHCQNPSASEQDQPNDDQTAAYEALILRREDCNDEIGAKNDVRPASVLFSGPDGTKKRLYPILEISSSLSSSGKSQLLYYLTARAILPQCCGLMRVGGQDAAVVFIDTDHRFDADRLRVVARSFIQQEQRKNCLDAGVQPDNKDMEALLVSSLQHVHVFRPQSSSALLATLQSLYSYLLDLSQHQSSSRPLQMIVIDSVTAFIWQDRLRDEVARTEEIGRSQEDIDYAREKGRSFHLADLYAELANGLKQLQNRFQCAIVYTSVVSGGRAVPDLYGSEVQVSSLRPALPAPWGILPTLRVIVHRSSVRPFPSSMALRAAVKDAPSRQNVVRQGKISVCVNTWGCDEWPRRIVEVIDASNGGSFSYFVCDAGVEITNQDDSILCTTSL